MKKIFLFFLFFSSYVFSQESGQTVDPVEVMNKIQSKLDNDLREITQFQDSNLEEKLLPKVQYGPRLPERYDKEPEKAADDTAKMVNAGLGFLAKEAGLSPNKCPASEQGNSSNASNNSSAGKQINDPTSANDFDESVAAPVYSKKEWSDFLREKIIEKKFTEMDGPGDAKNWCPNYATMTEEQKVDFWYFLMMGMSHFESGWDPRKSYPEDFGVLSSGLFQISVESARGYGEICSGITQSELFNAKRNVECSVHMLKSLLDGTDNYPNPGHSISAKNDKGWIGGSAYWSVLRAPEKKGGILKMIKENVPSCF